MSKSRSKIVRALRHFVSQKPMTVSVWCFDGLCKGEVHLTRRGTEQLRLTLPTNPAYKMAIYKITDKLTRNGEFAAIFLRGIPR